MFTRRRLLLILVIAAVAVCAMLWKPWEAAPTDMVLTTTVRSGTLTDTVSAVGVLEPARLVQVGAQVTGQLKAIHISLGAEVKEGDLIAEIDSLQQQNELRLAEAALSETRATAGARKITLDRSRLVFNRQNTLYEGNAGSGAELLDAEAAQKTAQAEYDLALVQIERATIEVEKAQTNLGYTRILAPIDGRVIALAAEPGQTLNAAQTTPVIAVIARTDLMTVRVQISEADIGRVAAGQKVRFTTFSDRHDERESTLRIVEPAPASVLNPAGSASSNPQGSQSGQAVYYDALFDAPNQNGQLMSSMTAEVTIVVAEAKNALIVPLEALRERQGKGPIFVTVGTRAGTMEEREVKIGLKTRNSAEILSGLSEGEEVVLKLETGADPAEGGAL